MIIWTKQQNFFFYVVIDLLCFYSRSLHLQQEKGEEKKKFRQSTQHFSFRGVFFLGGIRTFATSSSFLCSRAPNKKAKDGWDRRLNLNISFVREFASLKVLYYRFSLRQVPYSPRFSVLPWNFF